MTALNTPAAPRDVARTGLHAWLQLSVRAGEADFFERLLALLLEQSGAASGGLWMLVRSERGQGLTVKACRGFPREDAA